MKSTKSKSQVAMAIERADAVVTSYMEITGTRSYMDAVNDLLTDFCQLADRKEFDVQALLARASRLARQERDLERKGVRRSDA